MVARRTHNSTKHTMWMVWGLSVIVAGLSINLLFGRQGIRHVLDLKALMADLSDQTYERTVRNHDLYTELKALRSDERARDDAARVAIGVVGENEITYLFESRDEARLR